MSYLTQNTPILVQWLSSQPESAFPSGGLPYRDRLANVFNYLKEYVYQHVESGALLNDSGYLTDHGENHIRTVIARAADLVSSDGNTSMSAYEVYLLLQAAHFHDVGNIYGRSGHETKLAEVIGALGPLVGEDVPERRAIQQIASAHGGRIDGSKDTIGKLPQVEPVLGKQVHFQAVAATLRLADELADDSTRAARFMLSQNQINSTSEVFHKYALALHSVIVKPAQHNIQLHFQFTVNDATSDFGKADSRVYLLDEIFVRTLKMHCERMYCMRFMRDIARIDSIDVQIKVYQDNNCLSPMIDPIAYRLAESGYPDFTTSTIADFCPEVKMTGQSLCDRLLHPA
ncbi:MAG TPA: hypothetical protein VFE46_14255 [Pirellulales bacterium]|jgi:hypothetical protein|nr:hypothetical protein [Pirellulales bacterium]